MNPLPDASAIRRQHEPGGIPMTLPDDESSGSPAHRETSRSRPPRVVVIEPVGARGGMHLYNQGLCLGLMTADYEPMLFTSDHGSAALRCPFKVVPAFRARLAMRRKFYGRGSSCEGF